MAEDNGTQSVHGIVRDSVSPLFGDHAMEIGIACAFILLSTVVLYAKKTGDNGGKKKFEYKANEFGGPAGVTLMITALPILVMTFYALLTKFHGHLFIPNSWADIYAIRGAFPEPTLAGFLIYGVWFGWQTLLQLFGPGYKALGMPLVDGRRLVYNCNGFFAMCATFSGVIVLGYLDILSPTLLADHLGGLLWGAMITASSISVLLYLAHKLQMFGLKEEKTTGNDIYDFFMGGSINPRLGSFDLKCFCESRPGLLLWVLIDWSLAAKQYQELGTITGSMFVVCFLQTWYIVDYFWQEDAILTTMDIMHDKFGFMLCFGDLVFVPFTYSLQAFFLLTNPNVSLSPAALAGIVLLNFLGYYTFRSANNQKHSFRASFAPVKKDGQMQKKGPRETKKGKAETEFKIWGKTVNYISTKRGTKLLASGWWGLSRHPNYLGDLMMGIAWCAPCGLSSILPYFYAIYFAILLAHRERRDNDHCARKYGEDWDKYVAAVPSRIIPFVY